MSFQNEREPLDPEIYAKGMMMLSSVFPGININPDVYYALLEDLREDYFIEAIRRISRNTKELYPNSNLVALIREKSNEAMMDALSKTTGTYSKKRLLYEEPDYEKCEEARKGWKDLMRKLAPKEDEKE